MIYIDKRILTEWQKSLNLAIQDLVAGMSFYTQDKEGQNSLANLKELEKYLEETIKLKVK